jgi:exopolysaccharide biosynthesis polyprenyl glycosylphosphotransferase
MDASNLNPGRLSQPLREKLQFLEAELEDKGVSQKISASNGDFGAHFRENESIDVIRQLQDDKAARMLLIHADQSFNNTRAIQRIRILMMIWIIRYKIQNHLKRFFDLLVCCLVFPLFLPIMAATAVAIKLNSPGPVFFKQERVGKWGKPFGCYKFRSMYVDAEQRKTELMYLNEADQIVFKMKRDPRVTGVGRIIRKLSIDELPQILNVIKGDMSLVGPRPPVPIEVENYKFEHTLRLNAVPGITGLQQISGRSELEFIRWVELDLQYIEEQSLFKDIEILVKTIPAVISGRGAY